MTPEEQQQVNAMFRFYERQIGNLTTEGAQAMGAAEALAIKLKAAEDKIKELEKPTDNVGPIDKGAA